MRLLLTLVCILIVSMLAAAACPPGTSLVSQYASNHDLLRCMKLPNCAAACAAPWVQDYATCICVRLRPCPGQLTRKERVNGGNREVVCG